MTAQDLVLDCLKMGPRSMWEITHETGLRRTAAQNAIDTLRRDGHPVTLVNPGGGRDANRYCLTYRCLRCGATIARDNIGSILCSPCERKCMDIELQMIEVRA